jgi:RHS repeat-associated protein
MEMTMQKNRVNCSAEEVVCLQMFSNLLRDFCRRNTHIPLVAFSFMLMLTLANSVSAQHGVVPAGNAPGTPLGSYLLSDIESISLYSGKVNTVVPLVRVGGRGEAGYSMVYPINDAQWFTEADFQTQGTSILAIDQPYNAIYPWRTVFLRPFEFGTLSFRYTARDPACFDGSNYWTCYTYAAMVAVFTSADGTEHTLYDEKRGGIASEIGGIYPNQSWAPGLDRGLVFSAKDGSGWTFVADPETPQDTDYHVKTDRGFFANNLETGSRELPANGYLKNSDGTVVLFENARAQWIRDRNGNQTTFVYETSGPNNSKLDKVLDANNRVTDIVYGTGYEQVVYSGTAGQSRTITISHSSLQSRLISGNTIQYIAGLFPAYPQYGSPATFDNRNSVYNPVVVSTITLPDNRAYGLYYNSYGEMARMESPTGAAVEYSHGAGLAGSLIPSGASAIYVPNSNFPTQLNTDVKIYRRLLERREYPNGGSVPKLKTIYGRYETNPGKVREEQIDASTQEVLTRRDHFFHGDPTQWLDGCCSPPIGLDSDSQLMAGREVKTERVDVNSNTVLQRTENHWNPGCLEPRTLCGIGNNPAPWSPFVEWTKTSVYEPSSGQYQVTKKEYTYDNYNNLTDSYEYDFGTNQTGSFLRRSHIDYVADSSYTSESTAHLRSLPSQKWVSSDAVGTNKVSRTVYEYDNYATDANHTGLISRSTVTGHDSTNYSTGFAYRGNVTAVTSYSNAAAQTGAVTGYAQYDMLGNNVKTIDANGNATTTSYDDNFGAPDGEARTNTAPSQLNGQNTFAFPTSITNALGWTAYVQVDYFSGALVNTENVNGVISKTFYNHLLDRPTQSFTAVGTPNEMQSKVVYDDANRRVEATSDLYALNDNLIKGESFYDGLGRTSETRSYQDGGYVVSKVEFDALGRVKRVTNPYRPLLNEQPVWTESFYDALSRVIKVRTPDNAEALTSYSGNSVTVTDQANKKRRSITNAIGQLVRLDEPDLSGNLGSVTSPTQPTSYVYDTLNNLLQVQQTGTDTSQCGGGTSNCSQTRTFTYDSLSRIKSAANPESGNIQYVYDNNGNLIQKTDARGVITTFAHDALNRITSKSYSNEPSGQPLTPTVNYYYDGIYYDELNQLQQATGSVKGKLTSFSSSLSKTNFAEFDVLGGVKKIQQITDGTAYNPMLYSYDLSGALTEETYPSGRVVRNIFDNDGQLAIVQSKKNQNSGYWSYADNFTYTAAGAISSMQLGNGKWESTQFNSRLQPTQIALGLTPNATNLLKLNYEYGDLDASNGTVIANTNNGSVAKQTIAVPSKGSTQGFTAVQRYDHDALNRISLATEKITPDNQPEHGSWQQIFTYDRFGNKRFDAANTTTLTQGCTTAVCNPMVDPATNKLTGYVYDVAGNTKSDALGNQFIYDGESKQTQVKDSNGNLIGEYFYDGAGKRVKKKVYSGGQVTEETIFVYNTFGRLVAEYSTQLSQSPQISYLTADLLGSPRVTTDKDGGVFSRRDFLPFGEEITGVNTNSPERNLNLNYAEDGIRQKFTGYQKDSESELDYAQARYFNSKHGRFTSADPLMASATKTNPQSFNRYAYVLNNPATLTDPSGLCPPVDDNPCKIGDKNLATDEEWIKIKDDGTEGWSIINNTVIEMSDTNASDSKVRIITDPPPTNDPGNVIKAGGILAAILGAGGATGGTAGAGGTGIIGGGIFGGILSGGSGGGGSGGASPNTRRFGGAENKIAEFLRRECGCTVDPNQLEGTPGNGDALVDGKNHEFKTLEKGGKDAELQLKNRLEDSLRSHNGQGQGRDFVIDARNTTITANDAVSGIQRVMLNTKFRGRIDSVSVIGNGFFIVQETRLLPTR